MIKFNVKLGVLVIGLVSVVFLGCEKEVETFDESRFGYEYFPVAEGKSWTYASDSIIYDDNGTKIDTFKSFIKEEIGERLVDASGDSLYKVNRYFKRNLTDTWTRTNTWTVSLEKTRAIRTEENVKFVKLIFPFKKGSRWEGNEYVDENLKIDVAGESIEMYKNWKYRLDEVDVNVTFKGQDIPSLQVNLVDITSIIDRRKVTEYYGKGIGLIKKEMMILDNDGSKPNEVWEKKAQKGFIHLLTLIEYN